MIAALAPGFAAAEHAEPPVCVPRAVAADDLAEVYNETLIGIGLVDSVVVVEIWALEGGTFTILVTGADGVSCIAAEGDSWMSSPPAPSGEPG